MSKTTDYEIAKKLATITGRPLEDFYENKEDICDNSSVSASNTLAATSNDKRDNKHSNEERQHTSTTEGSIHETKQDKQTEKEQVERREEGVPRKIAEYVPQTGSNKNKDELPHHVATKLLEQYGGKLVNGKLLCPKRQMIRKEYLAEKKKFKTIDDFYNSPLMYLMFRSEGQLEPSFLRFTNRLEQEIDK